MIKLPMAMAIPGLLNFIVVKKYVTTPKLDHKALPTVRPICPNFWQGRIKIALNINYAALKCRLYDIFITPH